MGQTLGLRFILKMGHYCGLNERILLIFKPEYHKDIVSFKGIKTYGIQKLPLKKITTRQTFTFKNLDTIMKLGKSTKWD